MTLTLELSGETAHNLRSLAETRGQSLEKVALELLEAQTMSDNANNGASEVSPLRAAINQIKANPIRSRGPIDAVADLEALRAARTQELAG